MLSALIVDRRGGERASLSGLLRLTGWQVHLAADAEEAVRRSAGLDADLVVVDAEGHPGSPAGLLRRLRAGGSRARFLVVTADATADLRAEAADAGALACLAKPVDESVLFRFLQNRAERSADAADRAIPIRELADLHDVDLDDELMDRLQEMYASALPARVSAIARGARSGDAPALASAAQTLAGTSDQLGHPDVAAVCRAIAADARRGVLAHARVVELRGLVSG